jgi:hypothetical protein
VVWGNRADAEAGADAAFAPCCGRPTWSLYVATLSENTLRYREPDESARFGGATVVGTSRSISATDDATTARAGGCDDADDDSDNGAPEYCTFRGAGASSYSEYDVTDDDDAAAPGAVRTSSSPIPAPRYPGRGGDVYRVPGPRAAAEVDEWTLAAVPIAVLVTALLSCQLSVARVALVECDVVVYEVVVTCCIPPGA